MFYARNLPHWQLECASFFVTWRLYGSLPAQKRTARNGCATGGRTLQESAGQRFKRLDQALDRATYGPRWLKSTEVADAVLRAIQRGEKELHYFALHAFVILPNHVHLLITPRIELPRIMNGLKGSTAHEANIILNRISKPFWQDESFDHWVRSSKEFDSIRDYVERNPVAAGLVNYVGGWRWSSGYAPKPVKQA